MSEERFLVQKIKHSCKFRVSHETTAGGHTWVDFACGKSKKWKDCEEDDFIHCEKKELIGLSRQEAIERINHAICVEIHGPCDICEQVKGGNEGHCNDYKKYAEAALNALLEGK